MFYLAASCFALLLGPLFYRYFTSGSGLQKGLDGFIFVSLGGLVLIHILPELIEHGGLSSLIFVILGMWGPTASEKLFHKYSEVTHNLTLILGVGGLFLHTITDGGAMVLAQQQGSSPLLALGIILHRLPVGIAIWWLLKPQLGAKWAWTVLISMMLLTGMGYFAGTQMLNHLSLDNTVYLQAFVTGSILHVVLHQPHGEHNPDKHGKYEYQSGIGSLLGIGLLVILLSLQHSHSGHQHSSEELAHWIMLLSPALLMAYFIASLRYRFGLRADTTNLGLSWLQRIAGPEALIIPLLLLGPGVSLLQVGGLLLIGSYLTFNRIPLADYKESLPKSFWTFGFACQVQRSAPWIIFSLILANLIGSPTGLLANPLIQVLVLLLVFLPLRFCNLGGGVLALTLALSGWSQLAVLFTLFAASIVNICQLKLMSYKQIFGLVLLILFTLFSCNLSPQVWQSVISIPPQVCFISLIIVVVLFTASLLRMGPRKFLKQLMLERTRVHHH